MRTRRHGKSKRRAAGAELEAARSRIWAVQARKLRAMLREVLSRNPFYRRKFEGLDARSIRYREQLGELPFTAKQEWLEDQHEHPPYGTNLTYPLEDYCRLHQSSGTSGAPLRWLDTAESWRWFIRCWETIYRIIGLERSDRLFFPFSFGPFIGFWGAFEGAAAKDYFCLPAGGMTSSARLKQLLENRATIVACTPTYALRLAEVAAQESLDLARSSVRAIIVAGEPGGSVPGIRRVIESAWGARVFDHSGMTEIGAMTVECPENPGGLHVLESEFLVEVVDPERGHAVEDGAEGELVVTNLGRWGSPAIRYRTGDRVRVDPKPCPCGRTWLRLAGGILGRTDDMIVVRGNNLYPAAVEELVRSIPGVDEFRCTACLGGSEPKVRIELETAAENQAAADLAWRISRAFQDRFHFRAEVIPVPSGSLPRFELKARRFILERNQAPACPLTPGGKPG